MRASGILMPIFSLPSPYGIGTLGKEAKGFIDFLEKSGQTYWQILPIGPTGFGDSPYQSFSSFAGNPYFIDLDILKNEGYLKEEDYKNIKWCEKDSAVDYGKLYENKFKVLKIAAQNFKRENKDFVAFCEENEFWLEDYALFMAIKDSLNGCDLYNWEKPLRLRETAAIEKAKESLKEEIFVYKVIQYLFFSQWEEIKGYANEKGIKIIGDIPIYVAPDSADVWSYPCGFQLDKELCRTAVAGCPPDAFCKDGQLWGNPLYDWDYMKEDNYSWWCKRIENALKVFDVVRIDHFRAFDEYYSIPASSKTAAKGEWKAGPGKELFETIKEKIGDAPIIAEDLGFLTDSVEELLKATGFPGMAVLQFAFDPEDDNKYLPHNIDENTVVYTGTHDNNTIEGWVKNSNEKTLKFAVNYLRLKKEEGYNWGMMKAAMATRAKICILQMQDFMGLGEEARINRPSTDENNWQWRIDGGCLNDWLANIIKENVALYRRLPKKSK